MSHPVHSYGLSFRPVVQFVVEEDILFLLLVLLLLELARLSVAQYDPTSEAALGRQHQVGAVRPQDTAIEYGGRLVLRQVFDWTTQWHILLLVVRGGGPHCNADF